MRKRLAAIYSVLVIAIVLVAVLVPSCAPEERCTIEVKATLDGSPWSGAVQYTLTGPGGSISGDTVPETFSNVNCGNWTCAYVSGGPGGAYLDSITPSPTQSVSEGGTITFTLEFKTIPPETCTIEVKATLCGVPWPTQGTGAVNYTLTPGTGSPITGTSVPATHSGVAPGTWTCAYVAGGPAGAFLKSITPSATQTVSAGNTTTFILNFELKQDAAIQFLTWTVNGEPWLQGPTLEAMPCQIIDVHFKQWVNGCQGYNVTVNETSKLWIHYLGYTDQPGGQPVPGPANVWAYVVNDLCAVNKTVPQAPPPVKKSQVTSFKGVPILPPHDPIAVNFCDNSTYLDVETAWQLVKGLNYTKSINWFGITIAPGMHECVLFDLAFMPPVPGWYHFTLIAEAELKLVGAVDVNPANNKAMSPPLTLIVWIPGP